MQLKPLTDNDFQTEVREADLPTVVMFSFSWCKPCKRQLPNLERLADAFIDDVQFVTMDIEECPVTARDLGVRQAPTLMLFNEGMVRGTLQDSSASLLEIRQWINEEI